MTFTSLVTKLFPAEAVSAHCDGPCGVYDPASARIAAEAVVSMTNKLIAMDGQTDLNSVNNISRYIAIKEDQAHIAKTEILVLWTDYFKPTHLAKYPELHTLIWDTTKLLSACKTHVDADIASQMMEKIQEIHRVFWATKGRDITFYTAS